MVIFSVQSEIDELKEKIQHNEDEIATFKEEWKARWTALLDSDPIKYVDEIQWGSPLIVSGANEDGPALVNIGGLWGTICFDGFNYFAAKIFCKNLARQNTKGFHVINHDEVRSQTSLSDNQLPVLLTNVRCNENATTVDDCSSGPMGYSNCPSGKDVAVICGP